MLESLKKILKTRTTYGKTRYLNYLYHYDMDRYYKQSCMGNSDKHNIGETKLRILIHTLEKGLSLPYVRPGFGQDKIKALISEYEEYCKYNTPDPQLTVLFYSIIHEYTKFQKEADNSYDTDWIPEQYLIYRGPSVSGVGTSEERNFKTLSFDEFAKSRHSIRYYDNKPLTRENIREVITLAQTSPSACNRQPINVYACLSEEKISAITQLHGGTLGFGKPQAILVITGDLILYQNEYERNTVFVDGGIFTMNLLYSIHYYGFAACPVIWGMEPDNDRALYKAIDIPQSHVVISLITVGYYPKEIYRYARSERRDPDDILHFV